MKTIKELMAVQPQLRDYLYQLEKLISGSAGLKWVLTPATVTTAPLSTVWTRTVTIELQDSDGKLQEWFTKDITTGVSIADTSSAGTASIVSTTLSVVNGKATVVVSGDAQDWLGGIAQVETITCTGAPSSDGDITLEVTSALLTVAKDVVVSLVALTHTTVTLVAEEVVDALNADADVSAHFVASNVAGAVKLTAKVPAANDATLAFAFTDTDTTGTTFGASSDTTAGVAKETDTLTVAQATIMAMTVAAKTSVETFSA